MPKKGAPSLENLEWAANSQKANELARKKFDAMREERWRFGTRNQRRLAGKKRLWRLAKLSATKEIYQTRRTHFPPRTFAEIEHRHDPVPKMPEKSRRSRIAVATPALPCGAVSEKPRDRVATKTVEVKKKKKTAAVTP